MEASGANSEATDRRSFLARSDLFRGVEAQELDYLVPLTQYRSYRVDQPIVREGDKGTALYIITEGKVRVTQRAVNGEEYEIRTMGPGTAFGEIALFLEQPRTATVTAIEQTRCLLLDRQQFLNKVRERPELAIRLLQTLCLRLIDAEKRI